MLPWPGILIVVCAKINNNCYQLSDYFFIFVATVVLRVMLSKSLLVLVSFVYIASCINIDMVLSKFLREKELPLTMLNKETQEKFGSNVSDDSSKDINCLYLF